MLTEPVRGSGRARKGCARDGLGQADDAASCPRFGRAGIGGEPACARSSIQPSGRTCSRSHAHTWAVVDYAYETAQHAEHDGHHAA